MSPEELQSLVNLVEEKLQSDLILVSEIGGYSSLNSMGRKQKYKYLGIRLLQLFGWFHQVLVCYCCMTGSKSSSLYFVDLLHGFGPLGCITSATYMCGYTLLLFHLRVIYCQERKHKLDLLTHMKTAHELHFTPNERKEYARNLYWMLIKNNILLLLGGLPMTGFYLVGAIVTGMEMKSWYFAISSCFMLVMYGVTGYNCVIIFTNVHLMIGHSTNYFRIQTKKLRLTIQDWVNQGTNENSLNALTIKLENLLTELKQHNNTVKLFLRDMQIVMAPLFATELVFLASNSQWYLKILIAGGASIIAFTAMYTLYNASGLHISLIKLSHDLHSCQVNLLARNDIDLKCKFRLFRLIHRTSSSNVPVGFTVGNTGSFTPGSAGLFISRVTSVTFIFLNSSLIKLM